MTQLTQGMYGTEFQRQGNLFGLRCGQMRSGGTKRTHNSGWYNKSGEKLGWGDLASEDMIRIAIELSQGELFIVLSEDDSHWEAGQRGVCESAPGVDYITKYARYVIAPGRIYRITNWEDETGSEQVDGHEVLTIHRKEAGRLIGK